MSDENLSEKLRNLTLLQRKLAPPPRRSHPSPAVEVDYTQNEKLLQNTWATLDGKMNSVGSMKRLPATAALCLSFLVLSSLNCWAADALTIARSTDEHYNRLKTFKTEFTEVYQGPGVSRTESGTLWLKKPGQMRWEYLKPREKLFLTDSHMAFFYVPGERQARKTPLKNLDDIRSPLRYLLGKTKLEKELDGLSLAPDRTPAKAGDTVLRGVPKGMKDRISEVLLEISPSFQIDRIVIQEIDGTTTDFAFSNTQENIAVADSLFRFTPPAGVEVIEQSSFTE